MAVFKPISRTCSFLFTRLLLLTAAASFLSALAESQSELHSLNRNSSLASKVENNNNTNNLLNFLTRPFDGATALHLNSSNLADAASNSSSNLADLSEKVGPSTTNQGNCHQQLNNGTCGTPPHNGNSVAKLIETLPFLPIGVVLGLMFFCLCLVLRLFSKARFRNNRSSIFVNPQTLKVAQAQERRLSQLSQLSGHSGLRTPRSPRTPTRSPVHSTSRSARSSYSSNVYPINESASNLHTPTNSVLMKAKSRSNSISSSKLLP